MLRKLSFLLLVLTIFTAPIGWVQAAPDGGVVGNGTPESCTEAALDAALVGGGIVTFNCGGPKTILVLGQKTITQDTTLRGGGVITLTGGLATRLFSVVSPASLTLEDITLDSAYAVGSDGGAISSSGTLTLSNVTIQYSQTDIDHCGGAIWSDGVTYITNSTFTHNTGGSGGGAICTGTTNTPRVQIAHSNFTSNGTASSTLGYGGAIWLGSQSEMTFIGGGLSVNTARYGGGLYLSSGATATISGDQQGFVTITDNTAQFDGGAIYNSGGTLILVSANLIGNSTPTASSAIGYGGAIANLGTMTLYGDYFSLNAARYGGAVYIGGSVINAQTIIEHTSFNQNTATLSGGGLYMNMETTVVTVTNSIINGNSAATGGGISRFNTHLRIENSSITQNTATSSGGGLSTSAGPQVDTGGFVEVVNTTISSNTATDVGGGVYNNGLIELKNVTIKDNTNGVNNFGSGEIMRLHNVVLDNLSQLNCDGDGTLPTSLGGNFSNDNSCGLAGAGDQQGVGLDPMLGPLVVVPQTYTFFHMPQAGSPLINAATPVCPARDQRYASRPDACDIGAVEFGGLLPVVYLPIVRK